MFSFLPLFLTPECLIEHKSVDLFSIKTVPVWIQRIHVQSKLQILLRFIVLYVRSLLRTEFLGHVQYGLLHARCELALHWGWRYGGTSRSSCCRRRCYRRNSSIYTFASIGVVPTLMASLIVVFFSGVFFLWTMSSSSLLLGHTLEVRTGTGVGAKGMDEANKLHYISKCTIKHITTSKSKASY
jgi:hypothetical protein